MLQNKIIHMAMLVSLLSACSDDNDRPKPPSRLETKDEVLPVDTEGAGSVPTTDETTIQLSGILDDLLALTPQLSLVGTLSSPVMSGVSLHASDITVSGNKVYVAYNTAGEVKKGGIDVIDISTPNSPALVSEGLYSDIDINKVAVHGTALYAAGSTTLGAGGAVLQKITLDASGKLTPTIASVPLQSAASAGTAAYAGTSVVANGTNVFALSGNNGGLSVLKASDLSTLSFTAIDEARDVAIDPLSSSVYVVTGKTASADAGIKRYNQSNGAVQATYSVSLPNATLDGGKSTIYAGSVAQIATAGTGGARLICSGSAASLGVAPNPAIAGIAAGDQVANAAAFGNGMMYVANGGAGIAIYAVKVPLIQIGCSGVTLTYLGRLSLGNDASVNNVFYSNGYLVAATGAKGFSIIKVSQSLLSTLLMIL